MPTPQEKVAVADVAPELFPRRALDRLLRWLLAGAALYALVVVLSDDAGQVRAAFASVSSRAVLLAIALSLTSFALRFARWQGYLRLTGVVVPFTDSLLVFLAGLLLSATPGKVGEVVKSLLLKERHGAAVAVTAPIVVAERLTDLIAILMLGGYGVLWAAPKWAPIAWAALGSVVLGLGLAFWQRPRAAALLSRLLRFELARRFRDRLTSAAAGLSRLFAPRPFCGAALLSLLAWGTQAACLPVIAGQLPGGQMSAAQSCLAYAGPLLLGTASLIPGGLGATEASMTGILTWSAAGRLTAGQALATTLLVRIITFWLAVALGGVAVLLWRLTRPASAPRAD